MPLRHRSLSRALLAGIVCLGFSSGLLAQSRMVFPHIVDGDGVQMEILFTNPGPQPETGQLLLRGSDGEPAEFLLEGALRSSIAVSVPAGGVMSLRSQGRGAVKVGYAVFLPDRPDSQLTAILVFTVNGSFQLSVPISEGAKQGHYLAEHNAQVRSGLAVANDSEDDLSLLIRLLDAQGGLQSQKTLTLGPFEKRSFFLSEEFEGLAQGEFRGSVHLQSDQPFHLLALRQRSNGSLTSLAGGAAAFPNAGSQLLFLLDSGVDPRLIDDISLDQLKGSTVQQLSDISEPTRSPRIQLENTHPDNAVTVQIRLLNDRCEEVLRFLMVLGCGEVRTFEPLSFEIPGSELTTAQLLFGDDEELSVDPISAHDFGDGRFLVEIQAVGTSSDDGDRADILFPNELAPVGACNVTPINTGASAGPGDNLWICNARPMSFDYLTGGIVRPFVRDDEPQLCRGRRVLGDRLMERASGFLWDLTRDNTGCLRTAPSPSCRLRKVFDQLPDTDCVGTSVGVAIVIRSPDPTYTLRR